MILRIENFCAFYNFVGVETGSGKRGDTTTVAQIAQWKYVYNTQYTIQLHKYTFTHLHFTQLPDLCKRQIISLFNRNVFLIYNVHNLV